MAGLNSCSSTPTPVPLSSPAHLPCFSGVCWSPLPLQGIAFGMLASYIPSGVVPGLGRVNGTAWSLTDLLLGEGCMSCMAATGMGWAAARAHAATRLQMHSRRAMPGLLTTIFVQCSADSSTLLPQAWRWRAATRWQAAWPTGAKCAGWACGAALAALRPRACCPWPCWRPSARLETWEGRTWWEGTVCKAAEGKLWRALIARKLGTPALPGRRAPTLLHCAILYGQLGTCLHTVDYQVHAFVV